MERFKKTLGSYQLTVEAYSQPGWNTSWNGYAFCPVPGCSRYQLEAFQARSRTTAKKAAGDAFALLRKHYNRKHK